MATAASTRTEAVCSSIWASSWPREPSSILTTRLATSAMSTAPSNSSVRVSWTRAIEVIRRTESSRAATACGWSPSLRAWSRSRDATVWRLFLTRWWTSRMVASRREMTRSRRRSSVASRTSTRAPRRPVSRSSGTTRTSVTAPAASISDSTGRPPAMASATRMAARWGSGWPNGRALVPMRRKAEVALGLANSTRPLASSTTRPSPTLGEAVGSMASTNGKVPVATISSSASAAPR